MVDAADNRDSDEAAEKSAGAGKLKFILFAVVLSLVLSGISVGVTLLVVGGDDDQQARVEQADDEEDAEAEAEDVREIDPDEPPKYVDMDPKFVVSFRDQKNARFMQFSLQVMTRDEDVIKQLKQHMPAVRSSLLLLVGSQEYESVSTREGKRELLAGIAEDINRTLDELAGISGVEAAYFDSFVVQ